MNSLYNDLIKGLEEDISYEKGNSKAKEKTYKISLVRKYDGNEIREIRTKAGMTQNVFALYMGVVKTVRVWESGRLHPSGPVFRLMDILSEGEKVDYIMVTYKG